MRIAARISILLLVPLAVFAADPAPIGSIVAIRGYAHAVGKDAKVRVLKIKAPVYLNEKVVTGEGARIQIMFKDTTLISQGEKSELLLNSYVYSPDKKKPAGATFGMKKGLFRVLTGKITDLNPDRFKVKTRMATIGIRGCHLGFDVDEAGEDVYVLWLPHGKSVLIETDAGPGAGRRRQRDSVMQIVESGIAIAVQPGSALESRAVDPTDARQLFLDTSVLGGDVSGGKSDPAEEADEFSDVSELLNGFAEESTESEHGQGSATGQNPDDPLVDDRLVLRRTASRPGLDEEVPVDMAVPRFPGNEEIPRPTEPPPSDPVVVPTLPAQLVAQGGGWANPVLPADDWVWTLHREYVDGDASGTPTGPYAVDYGAFGAPNGVGESLPVATVGTLLADTFTRNLSGIGSAAAAVDAAGIFKELHGSANLAVDIGGGFNDWTGVFNLSNTDGDSLVFDINGTISTSGTLNGTHGAYSLTVDGMPYDVATMTSESVEGGLIGAGDGVTGGVNPTAISSLAGGFIFVHGTAMRVDGVFGGPLN